MKSKLTLAPPSPRVAAPAPGAPLHPACDALLLWVGLMVMGARQCDGRRRASFSTIINGVKVPEDFTGLASAPGGGACASVCAAGEVDVASLALAPSTTTSTTTTPPIFTPRKALETAASQDADLRASVRRLQRVCAAIIDDIKDAAYARTFTEPALLYAELKADHSVLTDLDVHGANTYLALLLANTGILLRRPPLFDDMKIGLVDAMATGLEASVRELWSPEHRDTPWRQIKLKSMPANGSVVRLMSNTFIWPVHAAIDAGDYAKRSTHDAQSSDAALRTRFAAYVQQFCSYFHADHLLPRLFSSLTGNSFQLEMFGAETVARDLQRVFEELKKASIGGIRESQASNVNEWVWNVEDYPPVFNAGAARTLFAALGVCKESESEESAQPAAASSSAGGGCTVCGE